MQIYRMMTGRPILSDFKGQPTIRFGLWNHPFWITPHPVASVLIDFCRGIYKESEYFFHIMVLHFSFLKEVSLVIKMFNFFALDLTGFNNGLTSLLMVSRENKMLLRLSSREAVGR